ncbi:MAG: hypothetical protein Q8S84_04050 [bacterium]|nr:hypothetical protein [bacterium]MDP3380679.1 hypothetical protein [bacterium]
MKSVTHARGLSISSGHATHKKSYIFEPSHLAILIASHCNR